jgi:hypothetical protein
MNSRPYHDDDGQDSPRVALEKEATIVANQISGLGYRLQQQREIREHPKVLGALFNLAELLPYPDEAVGRHRSISQQISDAFGDDLKPNPNTATTPAEFNGTLRQYKAWCGDPSWRAIARKAAKKTGIVVIHSTIWNAVNSASLPKMEVVKAIVIGCDGSEDDLNSFVAAWRRIALNKARDSFRPVSRPS